MIYFLTETGFPPRGHVIVFAFHVPVFLARGVVWLAVNTCHPNSGQKVGPIAAGRVYLVALGDGSLGADDIVRKSVLLRL